MPLFHETAEIQADRKSIAKIWSKISTINCLNAVQISQELLKYITVLSLT